MIALQSIDSSSIDRTILDRFTYVVDQVPDKLAIDDGNVSLTYSELNVLVDRYANYIIDRTSESNVNKDDTQCRTAIYLHKSADFIALVLAVLKAGHVYVPLDPEYPDSRNKFILEDSGVSLILTEKALESSLESVLPEQCAIALLEDVPSITSGDSTDVKVSADDLAYLIYTSGSTGNPKGVIQNHRNTLHGCMRRSDIQNIQTEDRMSLLYSCSVMGSVYCIFGALLNGASLHPYDIRIQGLGDALSAWLLEHKITVFHTVASVFRAFATEYTGKGNSYSARLVIFGGEKCFSSDAVMARELFGQEICIFTGLGSTETGTVRHYLIGPETDLSMNVVPIGYPVDGVKIELRDDQGNEVTQGEVGEITVISKYIALGYWNNAEATDSVFSIDSKEPDVRVYHMGDLAVEHPDGMLEHKGRKDFQVKIRGFRVETAEVESALVSNPFINDAVVASTQLENETQLVAYIVAEPGETLTIRGVRDHLEDKLPYYMVPSLLVELQVLPKTPNNKVDRKALPEPNQQNMLRQSELVPPGNENEKVIVEICAQLLKAAEIGINHNFFELGGDSLKATQLISRVNTQFSVNLNMRDVFAASDLRELSQEIGTQRNQVKGVTDTPDFITRNDDFPPVSQAQKRMWVMGKMYGASSTYNISNTVRLKGSINIEALEFAINKILQRHDVLRARFSEKDSEPWLDIRDAEPFQLQITDFSVLPESKAQSEALAMAKAQLKHIHDVSKDMLFDANLIRISSRECILGLTFNHIIYDNIWSSGIFFNELNVWYKDKCGQGEATLTDLSFQFSDYSAWEQERINTLDMGNHVSYWKEHLKNLPTALELPADFPRPDVPTFKGGQVDFEIPKELYRSIETLCQKEGVTTFMVLVSVWLLLLHRYSGQDDVVIGTPTGRRYRPETEDMIGLFINNIVLRSQLGEDENYRSYLQSVKKIVIDAFCHDEAPFELLISELQPDRNFGMAPFFQHFFIHRNAKESEWAIGDLNVEPLQLHTGGSKFDTTFSVIEFKDSVNIALEFSLDLYLEETMLRISEDFSQLLQSIVSQPDLGVYELPLVAEKRQGVLLEEWNDTYSDESKVGSALDLFESMSVQYPDNLAVNSQNGLFTYSQLNSMAEQIAIELVNTGVRPGQLVAICLERSEKIIASILAVWKAGCAYVPLDPDYPEDRLQYMVEDSKAVSVITMEGLKERFEDKASLLLLDSELKEQGKESDTSITLPGVDKNDLAYVIYTSGSTGKPKGVRIVHLGLSNYLTYTSDYLEVSTEDRFLVLVTVCFDISIFEIFCPLISGASIVIRDRSLSVSPKRIIEVLAEEKVTAMQATPTTWRMLVDSGWAGEPHIRVLTGGEALGVELAEKVLDTGCHIFNFYGPTETTIYSSINRVKEKADASYIGLPIKNTQLYVVNSANSLQPVGVAGELLIGGDGVALGYLNRPDLSAEKFISNPFITEGKAYYTGDSVVRRPDGKIEFLGRLDSQVKIRGFRIELGEIESALNRNEVVRHSVVIAKDISEGEKKLVAYLELEEGCVNTSELSTTLRSLLQKSLPDYMVPSFFVVMEKFPVTPAGKTDVKRLPDPVDDLQTQRENRGGEVEAARHDLDVAMLDSWGKVLGIKNITIDDDFFSLGGDSILAIKLVDEIYQSTGISFSLAALFQYSNIRNLVDTAGSVADGASNVVSLNNVTEGVPVYCLVGVLIYKELALGFSENPFFGVYAKEEVAMHKVYSNNADDISVLNLVDTYVDAIVRHSDSLEVSLVGFSFGGMLCLAVAKALEEKGFVIKNIVLMDTLLPMTYDRRLIPFIKDLANVTMEGKLFNVFTRAVNRRLKKRDKQKKRIENVQKVSNNMRNHRKELQKLSNRFDLAKLSYDFEVLLIKATKNNYGLGIRLKHDYGFSSIVTKKITLREIKTNHRGMLQGEEIKSLRKFVQDYFNSKG